jgi:hypothetical protein
VPGLYNGAPEGWRWRVVLRWVWLGVLRGGLHCTRRCREGADTWRVLEDPPVVGYEPEGVAAVEGGVGGVEPEGCRVEGRPEGVA